MKKHFYWFGIIGPVIYIFTVILAGFLIPNYNHFHNAVSQIGILCEKKYLIFITPLFCLYDLTIIIYGFYIYFEHYKLKLLNRLQALILIIIGFCGLVVNYFPMTPFDEGITITGSIHLAFVCFVFIFSMFLTISSALLLKNKKVGLFSLYISITLVVFGCLTGISFLLGMLPFFGLIERIAILSFMIWYFVISIVYKKLIDTFDI